MIKKVIKPSKEEKDRGVNWKSFEIEIFDLNLDARCKINTIHSKAVQNKFFDMQYAVDVIKSGTDMSDDEINQYSTSQLFTIASEIVLESMLEKKKK